MLCYTLQATTSKTSTAAASPRLVALVSLVGVVTSCLFALSLCLAFVSDVAKDKKGNTVHTEFLILICGALQLSSNAIGNFVLSRKFRKALVEVVMCGLV